MFDSRGLTGLVTSSKYRIHKLFQGIDTNNGGQPFDVIEPNNLGTMQKVRETTLLCFCDKKPGDLQCGSTVEHRTVHNSAKLYR